jgi:Nucleoside-diphosphate-sugar pyrophosphorylase involved in lipopolysaccharide biosynthesis/translation initiation factor 2B, gamma/epsilon subunits (eIF-2Bgamma/eIF-2Bepsilon)
LLHKSSTTVSSYQLQTQFGVLETNQDYCVTSFKEKPLLDAWINIGYFIFEKKKLSKDSISFADYLTQLSQMKELYAYKHSGIHITINTLTELKKAKKEIKNFKGS